ncbi:MAG: aldehyde dehydrogenase EutE [Spirochaetaceae bacterium]|nr:aldehyde dehydrogenase EutE [Spirochaetaceae bacterium]
MLQDDLKKVIAEVLKDFKLEDLTESPQIQTEESPIPSGPGLFSDLETAISTAREAQLKLMELGLDKRREIIAAMRQAFLDNARIIAEKAVAETGMGNVDDKTIKNTLAASKTPGVEDVEPSVFTDEHGLTLVERAPYGVIGAIIPSTNPTATVISNGIGMVAAGNTVVFNPHPAARECSCLAVSLINEAVAKIGGPAHLLTAVAEPTIQTAEQLMTHKDIALLVVTGGPGVVRAAMRSEKKVIAAGPGNPPCVVDETADIVKAGRDIVAGAGFDCNIICICEKEVIVVESVADALKEAMRSSGAYELTGDEISKVTELIIQDPGGPGNEGAVNKKYVGKSPMVIASHIGVYIPDGTKILLCEVDKDHPLLWTEQLMPVLPLVRVKDVDTAISLGFEMEHGYRHTAIMHSRNIDKLSDMAKLMNCSLFVKNGPSYAGLGNGGAGFTSFTIASPTGEGLTRARTFTRERRCTLVDRFRIV